MHRSIQTPAHAFITKIKD